ncbi:MAG: hypothetical protein MSH48_00980 [Mollicutes bacterium]|nr:hypothetical protein [Mollicutes bacterium]
MENFDKFLETFMTGDFFLIFLILMLIILLVLVLALVKTRTEYLEIVRREQEKIDLESKFKKQVEEPKKVTDVKKDEKIIEEESDILDELNNLMATSKEDMIDENKPLVKQIDVPNVKTYDDIIEEYENGEEENAVISTEELEKVTRKRMEDLGMNDNQVAIQKYEEEQEKKAIISYEQLLKNASNITLTYKEEKNKKGAPKVNKIEVQEKEVTQAVSYVAEEEYLKILKEFRLSLE